MRFETGVRYKFVVDGKLKAVLDTGQILFTREDVSFSGNPTDKHKMIDGQNYRLIENCDHSDFSETWMKSKDIPY